jgi:hypothetical protein
MQNACNFGFHLAGGIFLGRRQAWNQLGKALWFPALRKGDVDLHVWADCVSKAFTNLFVRLQRKVSNQELKENMSLVRMIHTWSMELSNAQQLTLCENRNRQHSLCAGWKIRLYCTTKLDVRRYTE